MAESYARSVFEAEIAVPQAQARIMRLDLAGPTDRIFRRERHYWLDMCLTPRPERVRGCYADHWGPHRYERLGEISLVPPGQALRLRTEGQGSQSSVVCEIKAEAIDRWLDGPIEWTDSRLAACLDIAHPHMRACLFRLAEEVNRPGPGSIVLAELIAGQLGSRSRAIARRSPRDRRPAALPPGGCGGSTSGCNWAARRPRWRSWPRCATCRCAN